MVFEASTSTSHAAVTDAFAALPSNIDASAAAASTGTMAVNSGRVTALAPGFRFHPTDQELVTYFLKSKICGKCFRFDAFSSVDFYKNEPWDHRLCTCCFALLFLFTRLLVLRVLIFQFFLLRLRLLL